MKAPNFVNRLIVQLAASRPGAWLFARILHHIDPIVFNLTGNRSTLTGFLGGVPVVLLTTTGRKSGQPRTVPLLGIRDPQRPGALAVIASNWGQQHNPGWFYNLKANPQATCTIEGEAQACLAHEAQGEEYARFWRLAEATYPGFPRHQERAAGRHIPIMVLESTDRAT
jgi:deazaflavin-dependent oxidoreductase (nitroreductase family)